MSGIRSDGNGALSNGKVIAGVGQQVIQIGDIRQGALVDRVGVDVLTHCAIKRAHQCGACPQTGVGVGETRRVDVAVSLGLSGVDGDSDGALGNGKVVACVGQQVIQVGGIRQAALVDRIGVDVFTRRAIKRAHQCGACPQTGIGVGETRRVDVAVSLGLPGIRSDGDGALSNGKVVAGISNGIVAIGR